MTAAPGTEADAPPRRSAQMIAEALISDIRAGRLAKDSPLPTERDLADRFATSRPTIREALSEMQHRGYLVGGGGKRPRVTRPSIGTILQSAAGHIREILGDAESGAHLEQMRQFIETGAAREAALRGDTLQLAKLNDALERNHAAIGTPGFAATDIAFHRALVSVIGNPVILQLHDMFVSTMLAQRPPTSDPDRHDRQAYDEHRTIYEAVLDRDLVTATEVMDRHLARSYRARLQATRPPRES